ncbi:unnamed protein product [Cyprideis torosa]|uniref:Uncharacterized protein n=1 Tax=Cyprideis torosa TaxID=163714 RepID=A0A7R9A110_9CRUS|nr:unnamed protein product [Cyprideis torosa]CAG0911529.1 unnamed protein product [Cyprideis torosa]
MGELCARLRALIRRANGNTSPLISTGELVLDPSKHSLTYQGNDVDLSPREFALLQALMLSAGKVLSRAHLEEHLYAWGQEVESNAVEVYIHHLRKKLHPSLIQTIRGVGYVIPEPKAH